MCGRFALNEIPALLGELFGIEWPAVPPRGNIAPSQSILALIRDTESSVPLILPLYWGLVPFWAKDVNIAHKMFNARAETAHMKPSFRAAMRHRRCLIPASGFYEWGNLPDSDDAAVAVAENLSLFPEMDSPAPSRRSAARKQPYFITRNDGVPMVFAGLWELWEGAKGEMLYSCTILTTKANSAIRPVHDRMPVILSPESWELWLDPLAQSHRDVGHLLAPLSPDVIRIEKADL